MIEFFQADCYENELTLSPFVNKIGYYKKTAFAIASELVLKLHRKVDSNSDKHHLGRHHCLPPIWESFY